MTIYTTIKKIIKYCTKDTITTRNHKNRKNQKNQKGHSNVMPSLQPYTWGFLQKFTLKTPPKTTLYRDVETDRNYNKLRGQLKSNGISVTNYLKTKLFGGVHKFKEYRFIKNDFGYNVVPNIHHYNLWINPNVDLMLDNRKIKRILDKIIRGDYIVFKNLPTNMSVSGIIHYHIFFST